MVTAHTTTLDRIRTVGEHIIQIRIQTATVIATIPTAIVTIRIVTAITPIETAITAVVASALDVVPEVLEAVATAEVAVVAVATDNRDNCSGKFYLSLQSFYNKIRYNYERV